MTSDYDGVEIQRGVLVVSDLDRALELWVGVLGMSVDSLNDQDQDSLAYQLFDAPLEAATRFATLNAGSDRPRSIGLYEVKGVPFEPQQGIRRGGVVMNANGRLDQIKEALPKMGLSMLREKELVADRGKGTETGFFDWDGNLVVLFEFPSEVAQRR